MVLTDKTRLLKAIIDKREGYFISSNGNVEKDQEVFPQLLSGLLRHYKKEYLIMVVNQAVKQKYYYAQNNFIRYLLSSSPLKESFS